MWLIRPSVDGTKLPRAGRVCNRSSFCGQAGWRRCLPATCGASTSWQRGISIETMSPNSVRRRHLPCRETPGPVLARPLPEALAGSSLPAFRHGVSCLAAFRPSFYWRPLSWQVRLPGALPQNLRSLSPSRSKGGRRSPDWWTLGRMNAACGCGSKRDRRQRGVPSGGSESSRQPTRDAAS